MAAKRHLIEVDEETAAELLQRATERGLSVPELLAEFAQDMGAPIEIEPGQVSELDRRWDAAQTQGSTVPHDKVVRWLDTWGTATFRPWRDR